MILGNYSNYNHDNHNKNNNSINNNVFSKSPWKNENDYSLLLGLGLRVCWRENLYAIANRNENLQVYFFP